MSVNKYAEKIILPPDVVKLIRKVVELDGSQLCSKDDRKEFIKCPEAEDL